MKYWEIILSLCVLGIAQADIVLKSDDLVITLNDTGHVTSLKSTTDQTEYAAPGQPSPLLQLFNEGTLHSPTNLTHDAANNTLQISFGDATATVAVQQKPTHITLEIIKASPLEAFDRVQWGTVATTIKETVGEVLGIVRNDTFAIGMLGLSPKTLGGPTDIDEGRDVARGRSAMATDWGSTLQAYTFDRSRPRTANVWGGQQPNMPIPPIPGETVVGSSIALFGVDAAKTLERIGEIEITEDLPHPMYNGTWSRMNKDLGRSYLIAGYNEENIDEMITYARQGNFLSLYHPGPFKSWGNYILNPKEFPNGEAGMKMCADKAKAAGLLIGVHTLTNFINTNDPYVTPIPDKRLAKTGSSALVADIDSKDTTIEVASPEFFNNTEFNWLKTVMIDEELIRYSKVSDSAPWQLLDCRRGAFGTKKADHKKVAEVGKLMDHSYKVFLSNYEMQSEIAKNLAELFNRTGITHFDFDGHEGCHSSGQGDFGPEMFAKVFYDNLDHFVHNGTSNSESFYWHINTCCNWGEPWYGGFRSSMAEYRINNQAMLERNFMPKMLGWFQLTKDTTLADIEWLMARSAGYNSGFAMATSQKELEFNPLTDALLDAIREWEALRMNDAFTDAQREAMRDTTREFHLAKNGDDYALHPYHVSETYSYEHYVRQPGEPTYAEWMYTQPGEDQPLQFMLEIKGDQGKIDNITLEFDNYNTFEIPFSMKAGYTLLCDGSRNLRLYDEKGRQVRNYELSEVPPTIANGPHDIIFTCEFEGDPKPVVQVQFKAMGQGESLK